MKIRFLCAAHRSALAGQPEKAINCWQNGFDRGHFLIEQKNLKGALTHLGCAFETAEILMTTKAVEANLAYELYTSSALLLIDVFAKLGHADQSQQTYWAVVKRLMQELSGDAESQLCVAEHLENLYKQVQQTNTMERKSDLSAAFLHHQLRTALH